MAMEHGTKLGPYEILSPLGAGGMGEVYRARDTTLGREVAIKILPVGVASNPERLQRFEREAKTIATLNHPNIVTIHGIHDENDQRFIAMELVEGEALDRLIAPGGMPLATIFDIAIPLADALAAAHDKGIVHRDLKPANVMVTKEGRVKVLDFGLAKLSTAGLGGSSPDDVTMSAPLTGRGVVIGTVPYMSPEQLRGDTVDHRTDLFSLGIMLYEMATGQRPFRGKTSAIITSSILRDTPRPLHELNGVLPRHLGRMIEHCLEKDAEQRFQSAKDIRNELRVLRKEVDSGSEVSESPSPSPPTSMAPPPSSTASAVPSGSALSAPTRRGEFWIGVGVLAVVVVLVGLWIGRGGTTPERPRKPNAGSVSSIRSIAVIPFASVGGDATQDYFVDGITGAITDDLAKISALKVTSARTMMRYKDSDSPLPQIAREISVEAFVTGDAVQLGDRIQIRARLVEASTQRQIWSDHYERDKRDILAVYSEVARAVADGVKIELTPSEQELLTTAPEVNWQAYDAYMRGLGYARLGTQQSCRIALTLFDQAIAIDAQFAHAYAAKAETYGFLGSTHLPPSETMPQMETAARAALTLDDGLAEAHVALGRYLIEYEWDWPAAEKEFKRALELNPGHGGARVALANWLAAMKRGDEAIAQLDMAVERDATVKYTAENYNGVAFMTRRFQRCVRDAMDALRVDEGFWPAHQWAGLAESQLGHYDNAIHHLRRAIAISGSPQIRAMLGGVLAVAQQPDQAKAIRKELEQRKDIEYVCPYEVATISIGLGEYDRAFDEINEACDDRAECVPWLQVDPRLDAIRDDPRFDRVLKRVGFEPPQRNRLTVQVNRRLAILPFENISNDSDTEYLSNEIPADIIDKLSGLSELSVISRSGTFRFDPANEDATSFGKRLGASVMLTGQLNARGDRLTIRAELVDVATNQQLWSKRYARDLTDIMALEADITQSISDALRIQLSATEQSQLVKAKTVNQEAYQSYLRGRFWYNKFTAASSRKALAHFEQAIAKDSSYASAYAGLANAYVLLGGWFGDMPPQEAFPKAREAANKSLEIDPKHADAYRSLAFIRLLYERDWRGAERDFLRAIQLNPASALAHTQYAVLLHVMGRFGTAQEERKRALALDPLSPIIHSALGWGHAQVGEYERAITQFRDALRLDSGFPPAFSGLGYTYLAEGKHENAIAAFQQGTLGNRNTSALGWLGLAYAKAGKRTKALAILDELEKAWTTGHGRLPAAMVHAALGDVERAFELLEVACDERESELVWLNTILPFDNLRGDPRFNDLLQRIGLEPDSE